MYAAGLIHVIELRLLNIAIMLAGVYFALKQFKRTHQGRLDYYKSMLTGVAAAAIGTSTFSLFLFIYMFIDGNLMQSIIDNEPLGKYMNPYIACFIVFLEGLFSGFMVTYLLTNFFASDTPAVDNVAEKLPQKVEPMRGDRLPERA
jgi:hypothetical protein